MELRHLKYFVAVADALNFTKAAEHLHLAQPSLTRQISNLEQEIGVRLFDRTKHRVSLTEEGRLFVVDARRILAMALESVESVRRLSRGETGQLNVGYVPNFHFDLLPETLGSFRQGSPQITLNLFEMTPVQQFKALEARKLDLAFVGLRPRAATEELLWQRVCEQPVLVALPSKHDLAQKRSVKLEELKSLFFVGMSETSYPGYRDWLNDTCRPASFSPKVLQEADFEAGLMTFVGAALGVALVRAPATKFPHSGVTFRPFIPAVRADYWVTWHKQNTSPGLQKYVEIIKAVAAR